MAIDYGLFESLTGPMASLGKLQESRNQKQMNDLKMMQMMRNMQMQELEQEKGIRAQIDIASKAADDILYNNRKFARQKDIDDFEQLHATDSGWEDIRNTIKEHGSVSNGRLYGNLDYKVSRYKDWVKNNEISQRVNANKPVLTNFLTYFGDDEKKHLLSKQSLKNYSNYKEGKNDKFSWGGPRGDYMKNLEERLENIPDDHALLIDDLVTYNEVAIRRDMMEDYGLSPEEALALGEIELKNYVTKELNLDVASGGVVFKNGAPIYGKLDEKITPMREVIESVQGVGQTGLLTVNDFLDFKKDDPDVNLSDVFQKAFMKTSFTDFDRNGGVGNKQTFSSKGKAGEVSIWPWKWLDLRSGRQIVASPQIFAHHHGTERALAETMAGNYIVEGKEGRKIISRYDDKKKRMYGVDMDGLYEGRSGSQITNKDIASVNLTGKDLWQESETMNLDFQGFHIAVEVSGKDNNGIPTSFLLTDTDNEDDLSKLRDQYGNKQINYVVVAELKDSDKVTFDDYYYKKLDMGNEAVAKIFNGKMHGDNKEDYYAVQKDYEDLNKLKVQKTYMNKQQMALELQGAKLMNLPDSSTFTQVVDAYDQDLMITLKTNGISTNKAQVASSIITSDLMIDSQKERTYPFVMESDKEGRPTKVANGPGQYMAYMAQKLKYGSKDPYISSMFKAIEEGPSAYEVWRSKHLSKSDKSKGDKIAKVVSKFNYVREQQ